MYDKMKKKTRIAYPRLTTQASVCFKNKSTFQTLEGCCDKNQSKNSLATTKKIHFLRPQQPVLAVEQIFQVQIQLFFFKVIFPVFDD